MTEKQAREDIIAKMTENLPMLRRAAKLSGAQLGHKMGITKAAISSYEVGKTKLSWVNALAMLLVFCTNSRSLTVLQVFVLTKANVDALELMFIVDAGMASIKKMNHIDSGVKKRKMGFGNDEKEADSHV